jgi:hypothetical protein
MRGGCAIERYREPLRRGCAACGCRDVIYHISGGIKEKKENPKQKGKQKGIWQCVINLHMTLERLVLVKLGGLLDMG